MKPPQRNIRLPIALCALGALLAGCGPSPPPHLFLVTADALRADHLSLNGYARQTSPALERFAKGAWNFTGAVTVIPKTAPAFTTLFSGLSPESHGVHSNPDRIPDGVALLAELLERGGYETAAFVSNPVLHARKGFARGFDRYEVLPAEDGVRRVTETFLRWGQARSWERPTFVWLHFIDPHGPYTPPRSLERLFLDDPLSRGQDRVPLEYEPSPFGPNKVLGALPRYQRIDGEDRVAFYVARYDAEIRHVDDAFDRVLEFLKDAELYGPSGIVFTSDHGESLGEHDYYFEHGWYAYDATLRIPLLVKAPRQTRGRGVADLVSLLDLLPTFLGLSGIPLPADRPGRDLLAGPPRTPVLVQNAGRYPRRYVGVRTELHKYLREESSGAEELYLLAEDPGETRNVAADHATLVRDLRLRLEALRADARARSVEGAVAREPDPETRRQLEALGYVE